MADDEQVDSQDAGKDTEVSAEEKQFQHDVEKHLEGGAEDSPERTGDSKKGEEADGPEAKKLTKKQESAVKAIGWTAGKVLAMDDEDMAFLNRQVKLRDDLSRHAGKAAYLQKQVDKLKGEAAKAKPEEAKAKVGEISEDDDYDDYRVKISDNFKALQDQYDDLREELANLKAGGAEEEVDSRGERERDVYFESLGDEWPQFGKGPMSELIDGSPEALARDELLEEATDKLAKAKKQGRTLTEEDAWDSALASLYTEEYKNAAVRRARKKSKTKQRGSPESPSGRTPHEAAKNSEEEFRVTIEKAIAATRA